jgi:protein O-mannosyl-transferase
MRTHRAIHSLIVIATLIAFGNLCRHDFTSWDDIYNISRNPRLNPPTLQSVAWYWANEANGLYIPLTYTTWGILARVAYLAQPDEHGIHLNPYVFHTANVLLHGLSALLVYSILRRLVPHAGAAGIGAMVFALHPVQVEPVGWAAGLKDVLCGCLSFAAILAYLQFVSPRGLSSDSAVEGGQKAPSQPSSEGPSPGTSSRPRAGTAARAAGPGLSATRCYAAGTLALLLAMLAKPTAMVVPAVALVLHLLVLRRPPREVMRWLWPWFLLSLLCAIIARLVQPAHGVPGAPLWARPLLVGNSLAFYLYKLVWPVHLGIDYGWRPTRIIGEWWFYMLWIIPLLLFTWLLLNVRRRPELLAAGAIFVIGASPVLGLVTFLFQYFSTVADHYLYISMLGPALAVAWLVSLRPRPGVMVFSAVILLALGARTIAQTRVWQNDFTLFTTAIRVNPQSFMSWHNLGFAQKQAGQLAEAEQSFRAALDLKPDYWEAHWNLADVLLATGQEDEALRHLREAMEHRRMLPERLRIDYREDHLRLGDTLMSLGRYGEAAEEYRLLLQLRPSHPVARQRLLDALGRSSAGSGDAPATMPANRSRP